MIRFLLSLTLAILSLSWAQAQSLRAVKNWGYMIDGSDPAAVAASGYDLVVIDYSRDGTGGTRFDPSDLARMKQMPNGGERLVLAYLSIGEAETYRDYWRSEWRVEANAPGWLDEENPDWEGNLKVRYWHPEWQALIFGSPRAYLDQILAAGFDGVYLDIIDAFEFYEDRRPAAAGEMVSLVSRLSNYGKTHADSRPFYVVGQNGERLVTHPAYLAAVDAIAKEDLYFSWEVDGHPANPSDTQESLRFLKWAQDVGKPVFVVEYVSAAESIKRTYESARAHGFIPHASRRNLDRLVVNEGYDPPTRFTGNSTNEREYSRGGEELSDALFFATTLPVGTTQVSLTADYFSERFEYSVEDRFGEERDLFTDEFYEIATIFDLSHALTDQFELGVRIPIVTAAVDAPGFERRETGLGNVGLTAAYGVEFGDEGSDILLLDLEFGLPTDTRSDDFAGGGHGLGALTYEHYWHRLGLTAIGSTDYFADRDYSGGEWNFNYLIGPSFQWSDRIYTAALIGQRSNFSIRQVDVSASVLLTERSSLELSYGQDIEGNVDARFFSVGLNYIFGAESK